MLINRVSIPTIAQCLADRRNLPDVIRVLQNQTIVEPMRIARKCSRVFNLLCAGGANGVTERAKYINRIRARVRAYWLNQVEQFAYRPNPEVISWRKRQLHYGVW